MGILESLIHKTFSHGVHPPASKEGTLDKPIRRLPFAPLLAIPLAQHIGKPSIPVAHPGQEVLRGEPIAEADGFMSVPAHAPATGIVKGIELVPTVKGPKTKAIMLQVYPGADQRVLYGEHRDPEQLTRDALIKAVRDTGMVGLGGAAFPTHVKMSIPAEHRVDTVVVNGCECEPYLTNDHRVMVEETEALIAGTRIAMRATGAGRALIGVEDNKMDAVAAIREKLPEDGSISVHALKTKYPQGAEKMVVKALLGREIPSGGLPSAVGVSVYNVSTLAQLGALLPLGQGHIERVITVSGPGVKKPGNYRVAVGTPLGFVLEQAGYDPRAQHIIVGGPMMGHALASPDVPVTKATAGVLAFARVDDSGGWPYKVYPCIKCGKCVEACPLNLNPTQLGLLAAKREYETMAGDYHLFDCFECGSCSYVCPSNIPLVQYFRIAKAINREVRESA